MWACEELGFAEQKGILRLAARLAGCGMRTRKHIEHQMLALDPLSRREYQKVLNCSYRWRCNSPFCPDCSVHDPERNGLRLPSDTSLKSGVVNYIGPSARGTHSRNFRIGNGQRMTRPFDGLPREQVAAVTLMTGVARGGEDLSINHPCPSKDRKAHGEFTARWNIGLSQI